MQQPRYPVYVLSKGRHQRCRTARFLAKDNVPFRLVVEAHETELYREEFGDHVVELPPESSGRGAIPVRNCIWEHAKRDGAARHWILDDNILDVRRVHKRMRVPCDAGAAFSAVEDFVDRYENIGVAGLNYYSDPSLIREPFRLNVHVYSCMLIDTGLSVRWRGEYNADTDLCLQVLANGLCTVLINAFVCSKTHTMKTAGGNTDKYQGDGRLKMARALERVWPGVVKTSRRYGRPQHVVQWAKFKTPLKRRTDVDWESMPEVDERGIRMIDVGDA